MKYKSLLYPGLFLIIFCSGLWIGQPEPEDPYRDSAVNAVLGDKSYEETHQQKPGDVHYHERITTHLHYVIDKLSRRDVDHLDDEQQHNRQALLNELQHYTEAGNFPVNEDYDHPRPRFMDPYGNICAVGHLIAETEGMELVREIKEVYEYEYLLDMKDERISKWADENGFTQTELAMIQPAYNGDPFTVVETSEPYPVPLELTTFMVNAGIGIHSSANTINGDSNFWNSTASAALGTGTILMSTSDRANYDTAGLISGTVTLTVGLLGLADLGFNRYSENNEGLFSELLNESWDIQVGQEPGFSDSATISVGYSF